jgi:hypothetical protein
MGQRRVLTEPSIAAVAIGALVWLFWIWRGVVVVDEQLSVLREMDPLLLVVGTFAITLLGLGLAWIDWYYSEHMSWAALLSVPLNIIPCAFFGLISWGWLAGLSLGPS